ncbi:glycosyl transferase [Citrobacter amalonaticus]|uniref:Glycosyl transferase n=1 Tax=Citrobacter amalonaticus TaxID=35703 RepID=A0A2S4RRR1_CITAM|nr:glycosyltransferase [Citrobacter amalonaticus]POT58664.1 glycosyl transferase [Citrobacter amalonaticus]POT70402.1 glycosyl transferase [Citrobacter amalonaticus]POU61386.1 glycosyl transferase [Citrobacter amalonaticus]POV05046.1 glycosyl transferase [Citrobacter amalonaticus]
MSKSSKILPGLVKTLDTGREKPFVSVVTPTWNRAAFLPWLLYIYRYQDYPAQRRELVILDDSPQSHLPIIQRLTQGQPEAFNIRYIYSAEKLPLGKKRNMLNELAVGEYILCMDDDDFYPPDKISYTIAMMQRHRALISGSDQIPIWYSHINRIVKTHRFGPQNILNGTFCYHRNYLKKHRYDDDCNLSEEAGFTNQFTVNPLQLPGERTILCISHSENTFDKDFVLGSSEPLSTTLEQTIADPMLRNGYLSLHNATHNQPLQWDAVDRVVIVNLDKRPDRLRQIQQELTDLKFPAEKITRLAACDETNGQSGRRQSHLLALQLAQKQGWKNYLLLEDDAVILKQGKHIRVLNALLNALAKLPWEVILLGGEIKQGTMLKSLSGMIHARDCNKVCAYLVNSQYYATLAQQMQQDPSDTLEEQWQPLLREGKWLACYPSICYQRAGYSDTEKKETDNIRYYFNKINQSPASVQATSHHAAPAKNDAIAFFMETSFHYSVYRPIITALQAMGHTCTLVVNDRIHKPFLDEILETLKAIQDPSLGGCRISEAVRQRQRFTCLVSPYYTPALKDLADIHVRAMYGLAKEEWNHAWWNTFYHRILCYSHYSQRALDINGSAKVVGNPRFDRWHQGNIDTTLPDALKLDARKPTLLYAPTYGALSSLPHWAEKLGNLRHDFNVICKLHHGTCSRPEEAASLALANKHLKKRADAPQYTHALLAKADFVLTDNSGFIFDAIHANKRVILLNWPGMQALLDGQQSYSSPHSAEQRIRKILPVADDMAELRMLLSASVDWDALQAPLETIRHDYCDPFMDGNAGVRAAQEIADAIACPAALQTNRLLTSLRNKLF